MSPGNSADGSRAPFALPALAVIAVGVVLLGPGRLRPVTGARLRGGPTEGADVRSWRLEVVERFGDVERPLVRRKFELLASSGSERSRSDGILDDEGAAAVLFPADRAKSPSIDISVFVDGVAEPIGTGRVSEPILRWMSGAKRRGGWVEGARAPSGLALRAAAARGVFAVPFADPLLAEVRSKGAAVPGVVVLATAEGADLSPPRAVTNERGRVTFALTPREHAVSVALRAERAPGDDAALDLAPAVVPGALHAELSGGRLVVESPIARDRAYVAIVDASSRIDGGTVRLRTDSDGVARGAAAFALGESRPLWAVVSSEPDLRSPAVVGWPLISDGGDPPSTFDVPDVLLWDGVAVAIRLEAMRARRVRLEGGAFAVAILVLSAALIARKAVRARAELEAALGAALTDEESASRVAGTGGGSSYFVLLAVLCILFGAVLVFVLSVWR